MDSKPLFRIENKLVDLDMFLDVMEQHNILGFEEGIDETLDRVYYNKERTG